MRCRSNGLFRVLSRCPLHSGSHQPARLPLRLPWAPFVSCFYLTRFNFCLRCFLVILAGRISALRAIDDCPAYIACFKGSQEPRDQQIGPPEKHVTVSSTIAPPIDRVRLD